MIAYNKGSIIGAETSYKSDNGQWYYKHSFQVWNGMLTRCYNKEYIKRNKQARGSKVSKEWLLYRNFDTWYNQNYIKGFKLDKDIKAKVQNNKLYSKETCKFIPLTCNFD